MFQEILYSSLHISLFLVALSQERSELSTHYSARRFGCTVGWLLGCVSVNFFMDPLHDPQKIIGSRKFQNQNVFHIILSNFFLGPPPPSHW